MSIWRQSRRVGGILLRQWLARLGLPRSIGAHAAIILYRFVSIQSSSNNSRSSTVGSSSAATFLIKLGEALLACVFLASKVQKRNKWSRLDAVLEAGYKTFYTILNPKKEEVAVLEEKVISAESQILRTLEYDIFWRNIDWIAVAAMGAGEMKESFVEDILTLH